MTCRSDRAVVLVPIAELERLHASAAAWKALAKRQRARLRQLAHRPTARLLAAQLDAGDPDTWRALAATARRERGSCRGICRAYGLSERTWYSWLRADTERGARLRVLVAAARDAPGGPPPHYRRRY